MEQLIRDIEAHAMLMGITPQKLLRDAINAEWGRWGRWKSGESTPTQAVVDRLRTHMAANPAPEAKGAA